VTTVTAVSLCDDANKPVYRNARVITLSTSYTVRTAEKVILH